MRITGSPTQDEPTTRNGMKRRVIGLLGGIGAGKTTVGHLFGELGADVIAADALVHRFLRQAPVRARIAGECAAESAARRSCSGLMMTADG